MSCYILFKLISTFAVFRRFIPISSPIFIDRATLSEALRCFAHIINITKYSNYKAHISILCVFPLVHIPPNTDEQTHASRVLFGAAHMRTTSPPRAYYSSCAPAALQISSQRPPTVTDTRIRDKYTVCRNNNCALVGSQPPTTTTTHMPHAPTTLAHTCRAAHCSSTSPRRTHAKQSRAFNVCLSSSR